jgi:hypothetical protein
MGAEKKRVEAYMLAAARKAGVPIPIGEIPDEEPDFRFNDEIPVLGIELSEVLRPASSNHGILPVEQESFHKEIIAKAQQDYYASSGAKPVHVSVRFTNTRGGKRDKRELTLALTRFVKANVERANPFVSLYRPETPDGFQALNREIGGVEKLEATPLAIYAHSLPPESAAKTNSFRLTAPIYQRVRVFGCFSIPESPWLEA